MLIAAIYGGTFVSQNCDMHFVFITVNSHDNSIAEMVLFTKGEIEEGRAV